MGYYNIFYIIRNIFYNFRRIFKYLAICLLFISFISVCLLLLCNTSEASTSIVATDDFLVEQEKSFQNQFVCFSLFPFLTNSQAWQDEVKPIWDDMHSGNLTPHIIVQQDTSQNRFIIHLYRFNSYDTYNRTSFDDGEYIYNVSDIPIVNSRFLYWYQNTDSIGTQQFPSSRTHFRMPTVAIGVRSDLLFDFYNMVYGSNGSGGGSSYDYTQILTDIKTYVQGIKTDTANLSLLNSILQAVNTIANISPIDYSSQLQDIADSISDMLDKQDEIISQNEEMIELQEDINENLDELNGFLQDTTYSSNSITNNMPHNDMPDPTASQVDNIFTMIRNVFSTDNAQDIVFTVPNTNQNITIPANLVTSHIPQPILILIQGFYWYIICRFIIKDISKTVERAKSGEILDAKDGNIKTDLL